MKAQNFTKLGIVGLLFVVLGFLIYSNTMNVPFHLDDRPNIVENPHIRLDVLGWQEIADAAFKSHCSNRPVANITFALNYYFHRYDLPGYHLVNIIVHILTSIVLYLLVKTTVKISALQSRNSSVPKSQSRDSSIPEGMGPSIVAFFGALLWLIHPVHTQSVTYVVQRMNGMAAMFYTLALLFYVKGRLAKGDEKRWAWFAGCALATILSLGSKEISATLPVFILLYEWYFLQDLDRAWLKRHLVHILGAFVVLVALTIAYKGTNPLDSIMSGYENRHFSLDQRLLTQLRVVVFYISLLVFPHPSRLNLDHHMPLSYSLVEPFTTLFSMIAISGLVVLAICMARKQRLISFCILWFFGNLIIESSVVPLELVFEHRTYLPSIFFPPIIVLLANNRCIGRKWALVSLFAGVAALCSLWTYQRNLAWKDPVTLWADCARKSKEKVRPHNNLGNALAVRGELDKAITEYSKALEIMPNDVGAHYNLGKALVEQGRHEEGIKHYYKAIDIYPKYPEAHNALAAALVQQGRRGEAIRHYFKAVELNPNYAEAHDALGVALAQEGRLAEAIQHHRKAFAIKPDFAQAYNNLGLTLVKAGKTAEGIKYYSESIRINPGFADAYCNMGNALVGQHEFSEAIRYYSKALRIRPNYPQARRNLKLVMGIIRRNDGATKAGKGHNPMGSARGVTRWDEHRK